MACSDNAAASNHKIMGICGHTISPQFVLGCFDIEDGNRAGGEEVYRLIEKLIGDGLGGAIPQNH